VEALSTPTICRLPDSRRHQLSAIARGPGERIVFEPYNKEAFERSFEWIAKHGIFEPGQMGSGDYGQAVFLAAH
jgi:hypothetical protein